MKELKWIIIDGKGRKRLAKPNEIMFQPLIDDGEISLEDGDLVLPNYEVNGNERKRTNRKKNSQV
jgi:hypothetical protein